MKNIFKNSLRYAFRQEPVALGGAVAEVAAEHIVEIRKVAVFLDGIPEYTLVVNKHDSLLPALEYLFQGLDATHGILHAHQAYAFFV